MAQRFEYDYLVFIGRFQPLHNGHLQVIKQALAVSRRLIVLTGSANVSRNPRNAWLASERIDMIESAIAEHTDLDADRVVCLPLDDFPYSENNTAWISEVQAQVNYVVSEHFGDDATNETIGLIGFSKDATSFYLKLFPDWKPCNVAAQFKTLNSSDIRNEFLTNFYRIPDEDHVPPSVRSYLREFTHTPDFQWLVNYRNEDQKTIKTYGVGPHMTADAIVVQSGHVLLIERKDHPGKGQLALPGGHLELYETLENCAIRELKEETNPSDEKGDLPPAMLRSFIDRSKTRLFDDPYRSTRGRVITQAFLFNLPARQNMFKFRGGSDGMNPKMYPLGTLNALDMFEDHYQILRVMTGT